MIHLFLYILILLRWLDNSLQMFYRVISHSRAVKLGDLRRRFEYKNLKESKKKKYINKYEYV